MRINELMKDHEDNEEGANMDLACANHSPKTVCPHMKAIYNHCTTLLKDKMEKGEHDEVNLEVMEDLDEAKHLGGD